VPLDDTYCVALGWVGRCICAFAIASEILLACFDRDGNYRPRATSGGWVGPFLFRSLLFGDADAFRPWSAGGRLPSRSHTWLARRSIIGF